MQAEERLQEVVPEQLINKLKERVWLKSHSLKSVEVFKYDMNLFNRFLVAENIPWSQCIEDPINTLDSYVIWQDKRGYAGATIHRTTHFAKKLLKFSGSKITYDDFKDRITMPKKVPCMDDKVNREQIRKIVLALKNLGLKVVLMLMKDTQGRPGELLGLKVLDFNLAHDPPYFNIPAECAKSEIPRELFFTEETKQVLITYLNARDRKNGFVFLSDSIDERDERAVQNAIMHKEHNYETAFRKLIKSHFDDMNQIIRDKNKEGKRYKYHIYSFKKFAFTVMADSLGEIAARAIKGDREYVLTYYRKSREERADDYRKIIPKLSVFQAEEVKDIREQAREKLDTMTKDDLKALLEYIDSKRVSRTL